MNSLGEKFFSANKESSFKEVVFLSDRQDYTFETASKLSYNLPRGWYELSRVSQKDRVEFTRDFWLDRIPYHPSAHPAFFEFFEKLDDIAVVLTQKMEGEPMDAELVYSLADNSSFFRGLPPSMDADIQELHAEVQVNLPRDYLSFLRIHNGFGKLSEMGVLEIQDLAEAKRKIMKQILQVEKPLRSGSKDVDPGSLFPFFEMLGLSSFQCFYADWYPSNEMGNVHFSGIDFTISDLTDKKAWPENLAFPSFSEWLATFLQGIDLCI